MVEIDRRDHAQLRHHYVGGVQPSAQAEFLSLDLIAQRVEELHRIGIVHRACSMRGCLRAARVSKRLLTMFDRASNRLLTRAARRFRISSLKAIFNPQGNAAPWPRT